MKRNKVPWIVLGILALAAIALFVFNPFGRETTESENARGTIGKLCPVNAYHVGDQLKSPCLLRPKEQCSFVDASNCQFFFSNISNYTIPQGSNVEVTKQRVEGNVQYVDIRPVN
jgi:hypothetical protein